jgi:hypothetical protein
MKKRLERLWDSLLIAACRFDFSEVSRLKERIADLLILVPYGEPIAGTV